ncbi:MAG: T9SS type A sorting domain-containing protein [Saprospiraceae bacterium]
MKTYYLIFVVLAISYQGISQSLSHDVIGSAGNEFVSNDVQLSWTLGEIVTTTLSTPNETLTQGFQQTELFAVSTRDVKNNYEISAYPNPFRDVIYIQKDNNEPLNFACIDLLGRTLHQEVLTEDTQMIDLSTLPSAIYLFRVTDDNGNLIKLIKIQKN